MRHALKHQANGAEIYGEFIGQRLQVFSPIFDEVIGALIESMLKVGELKLHQLEVCREGLFDLIMLGEARQPHEVFCLE